MGIQGIYQIRYCLNNGDRLARVVADLDLREWRYFMSAFLYFLKASSVSNSRDLLGFRPLTRNFIMFFDSPR